ncbi:MAG: DUF4143 domain-containing protein [Acidimicrobiia bacterium]|nr:DUF4143 domain-containing protein [Acidimicrobiia bacterium]MCY4432936.1 DUF4143 domain-containing protein [bacterium]
MSSYRERLVDPLIAEFLAELPAVSLVGPRASGKTTTAGRHARTVVRLDRQAESAVVAADPDAALENLPEPVLLDEWQEVPQVLGAVKRACDAEPRPGRFLLTGSVRAEVEAQTWPATGRVTRISMYPMTAGEHLGTSSAPLVDRIARGELGFSRNDACNLRDYVDLALQGGFPYAVTTLDSRAHRAWLDTYIDEIVTRDSALVSGGHDSTRLARYVEAYALNSSGIVDDTKLYTAAGIDRRTALGYRELLSRLYVIDELPAWTSNRLKRLSLASKRFLIDSSLLAALTGATSRTVMRDGNLLGKLLETFVVAQLRAQATVSEHRCRLFHLRQHHGRHEVDVVIELDAQEVIGIEIKATSAPSSSDARHLAWLCDQIGDRFTAGIVLHTGPASFPLADRLWALPISSLWT